ncbi:hypothetical protein [Pseudoalteromonas sp. OF7H-1]|uniref:hypothetical protein n=1 Tax=Pseudoalteromonas sp. OF7H-1 TaxID=2917755 RepID=UPI001EF6F2D5|nr:hypothetical protein [Pseudoalteromonas sp. OF7H-1]MCG7538981.1 hypothetical protein [Pseudoalteromonas sp. OF7H-1]
MKKVHEWIMAPHMIETSYAYLLSSKLMWQHNITVSIVHAALSLEILFKSFHAEVSGNEGQINEKYKLKTDGILKGKDKHDLLSLYDSLPTDIKRLFESDFTRDMLTKYRKVFVDSRYVYERDAISGGSDALASIADMLIRKTVEIYRQRGCDDIWITQYPNV